LDRLNNNLISNIFPTTINRHGWGGSYYKSNLRPPIQSRVVGEEKGKLGVLKD